MLPISKSRNTHRSSEGGTPPAAPTPLMRFTSWFKTRRPQQKEVLKDLLAKANCLSSLTIELPRGASNFTSQTLLSALAKQTFIAMESCYEKGARQITEEEKKHILYMAVADIVFGNNKKLEEDERVSIWSFMQRHPQQTSECFSLINHVMENVTYSKFLPTKLARMRSFPTPNITMQFEVIRSLNQLTQRSWLDSLSLTPTKKARYQKYARKLAVQVPAQPTAEYGGSPPTIVQLCPPYRWSLWRRSNPITISLESQQPKQALCMTFKSKDACQDTAPTAATHQSPVTPHEPHSHSLPVAAGRIKTALAHATQMLRKLVCRPPLPLPPPLLLGNETGTNLQDTLDTLDTLDIDNTPDTELPREWGSRLLKSPAYTQMLPAHRDLAHRFTLQLIESFRESKTLKKYGSKSPDQNHELTLVQGLPDHIIRKSKANRESLPYLQEQLYYKTWLDHSKIGFTGDAYIEEPHWEKQGDKYVVSTKIYLDEKKEVAVNTISMILIPSQSDSERSFTLCNVNIVYSPHLKRADALKWALVQSKVASYIRQKYCKNSEILKVNEKTVPISFSGAETAAAG